MWRAFDEIKENFSIANSNDEEKLVDLCKEQVQELLRVEILQILP